MFLCEPSWKYSAKLFGCQGYGLMVLEQYKVRPDGTLLTRGPGTYKIPSVANIPQQFNVTLLRDAGNPKAVYSSKVCVCV